MNKRRGFSLYDMEQFFRDVGAERVNEKAIVSMEQELRETVQELIEDASMYASYAGRNKLIKHSDILLASRGARGQKASANGAVLRNSIRRKKQLGKALSKRQALDRMVMVSVSRQASAPSSRKPG